MDGAALGGRELRWSTPKTLDVTVFVFHHWVRGGTSGKVLLRCTDPVYSREKLANKDSMCVVDARRLTRLGEQLRCVKNHIEMTGGARL